MSVSPPGRTQPSLVGRLLARVQGVVLGLLYLYFLVGCLVSSLAAREVVRGDWAEAGRGAGSQAVGRALFDVYHLGWGPVYDPFRPALPNDGLVPYHRGESGVVGFDLAALAALVVVPLVVRLGFVAARRVVG